MPYLESNGDAGDNESFNSALKTAAVVVGAVAFGQMAYKGIAEKFVRNGGKQLEKQTVAKKLYGKDGSDALRERAVRKIQNTNYNPEGAQYKVGKNWRGAPKVKRTDGSWYERTKENLRFFGKESKDLRGYNKDLKDMYYAKNNKKYGKGKYKGEPVDENSLRIGRHNSVVEGANNRKINIGDDSAVDLTKQIYNSKSNLKAGNYRSIEDDVAASNSIWGKPSLKRPNGKEKRVGWTEDKATRDANTQAKKSAKVDEAWNKRYEDYLDKRAQQNQPEVKDNKTNLQEEMDKRRKRRKENAPVGPVATPKPTDSLTNLQDLHPQYQQKTNVSQPPTTSYLNTQPPTNAEVQEGLESIIDNATNAPKENLSPGEKEAWKRMNNKQGGF